MNFTFDNLLGAPYRGGRILFCGHELLSPIANRLQVVDLGQSSVHTLRVEASTQIRVLCLSPCTRLLLMFDIEGRLLVINRSTERILHRMKFHSPVSCAKFSPGGKLVAIGVGNQLQIWKCPSLEKELAPMHLYRSFNAISDEITTLDWTNDAFGIAIGCRDTSTRIYTLDPVQDYKPAVLGGLRGCVMGVFFTSEETRKQSEIAGEEHDVGIDLITVGSTGEICEWSYKRTTPVFQDEYEDLPSSFNEQIQSSDLETASLEEMPLFVQTHHDVIAKTDSKRKDWSFHRGHWTRCFQRLLNLGGKTQLTSVDYHKDTGYMIVGLSTGRFELIKFPGFHSLYQVSISQGRLSSVSFSPGADWIAIGCAQLGQLLVWDWRTETHVLKQQGHYFDISSIAYSPDGAILATGADDCKIKVFSMATGFCYITFKEHLMPITDVKFLPNGNAMVSASLDGTVRAFDLIRYRNFRTFTAPDPVQFSCLAVDPQGEILAAGSLDSFQIFVWSIKTGKLLDILAAHEGPVSGLSFNSIQPVLASSSWDKTVKLWDVFSSSRGSTETLLHSHDVTTFTFSPDGKHLASACLDGSVHFWDPFEGEEEGTMVARRDITRGRFQTDRRIASPFSTEAHFTSMVYSADGCLLFAAGKSKFICIYDVQNLVLLRKIQTTSNKGLDGVLDMLNSKNLTDAGALDLIDDTKSENEDDELLPSILGADEMFDLPGMKKNKKPIIQTRSLSLSPTGRSFAAATTEGVLIYSLDAQQLFFDPLDLEEEVTPQAAEEAIRKQSYLVGIIIGLRLRDSNLVQKCFLSTPKKEVEVVMRQVPYGYGAQIIEVIANSLKKCPDLELLLTWAKHCCTVFGPKLMESQPGTKIALKQLNQVLMKFQEELGSTIQSNLNLMKYIQTAHKNSKSSYSTELMEIDG
eukprot:g244.t1